MSQILPQLAEQMMPAVRASVESLLATIAAQQQRIAELERRLGMHSGNSSRPRSSDPLDQQPAKAVKPPSGRRRGGQPGHAKRSRPLIPTAVCDQVEH